MAQLPMIKIAKTPLECWHEVLSVILFVFCFVYLITNWSSLPESIAIHFNARGEADGWGSKTFLFFPLIISLVLYIGLTFLRKIPHHFNYMTTITEQNAAYQYKTSLELLSWIKLELVVLFGFLQWAIIQNAKGETSILGVWQLPIVFVILLGTIIFYVIKLKK